MKRHRLILGLALLLSTAALGACSGNAFTTEGGAAGTGGGGAGDAGGGASGGTGGMGGAGGSAGSGGFSGSCVHPGECVFVSKGCCPACAISPETVASVNRNYQAEAINKYCPYDDPPPCQSCPEGSTEGNAKFIPACREGVCRVEDITKSPLTACNTPQDCTLISAGCCGSCHPPPWDIIALNKKMTAKYFNQVCNPLSGMDCPPCGDEFPPPDYAPVCQNHRCAVAIYDTAHPGGGHD